MSSSGIYDYSTTAANNNAAPPNGAPEGSTNGGTKGRDVNNILRQIMAELAQFIRDSPWIDLFAGLTVSQQSSTLLRIASADVTEHLPAGRIVQMVGSSTLYGTVTSAEFTGGNTDVTVIEHTGAGVPGSLTQVNVSLLTADAHPADLQARNYAIDGDFEVWRLGTSITSATPFNNADGNGFTAVHYLLSDGNDIVDISRDTSVVPLGSPSSCKFDIETANKKFAYFQPIENATAVQLRARIVSLGVKAQRTGTSPEALRLALIGWTGAANAITHPISAWGAAGVNPTLATDWEYARTPVANTALSTSFAQYKDEGLVVPDAVTNLGILIWLDDVTTTVGDFLHLAQLQLNLGPRLAAWNPIPLAQTEALTQRYLYATVPRNVAPQDNGHSFQGAIFTNSPAEAVPAIMCRHPVVMLQQPSVQIINPTTGTVGQINVGGTAGAALGNARVIQFDEYGGRIDNNTVVGGANGIYFAHILVDARYF